MDGERAAAEAAGAPRFRRRGSLCGFLRTVCCSCWDVGPSFGEAASPLVDALPLSNASDRLHLWEYYVRATEALECRSRRAAWWLHCLQVIRTTFSIILPAVLALQNLGPASQYIMWLTWALSLAVSLATGYLDLFSLRQNFETFTRATEYLKLEGWQFFTRTSRYRVYGTHDEALPLFIHRVGRIRRRLLDHRFPPAGKDPTLRRDFSSARLHEPNFSGAGGTPLSNFAITESSPNPIPGFVRISCDNAPRGSPPCSGVKASTVPLGDAPRTGIAHASTQHSSSSDGSLGSAGFRAQRQESFSPGTQARVASQDYSLALLRVAGFRNGSVHGGPRTEGEGGRGAMPAAIDESDLETTSDEERAV